MLAYLGCLLAGMGLAVVFGESPRFRRVQERVFPLTVLVLLFFMGVGIGRDPELGSKIARFGWNAAAVSVLTVAGSVLAVAALLGLFRRRR